MNTSAVRRTIGEVNLRWSSLRPSYRALMFMVWLQGLLTILGYWFFVKVLPYWYGCSWEVDRPPVSHMVKVLSPWLPPGGPLLVLWTGVLIGLLFIQTHRNPYQETAPRGSLALPLVLHFAMACSWAMIALISVPVLVHLFTELIR